MAAAGAATAAKSCWRSTRCAARQASTATARALRAQAGVITARASPKPIPT